jgi:trypsin
VALINSPKGTRPFCSGTVISANYILTAAHCVENRKPGSIRALTGSIGTYYYYYSNVGYFNIKKIVLHPNYNRENSYNNDIAILQLSRPLDLITIAGAICLPADTTQTYANNFYMTIAGWGESTRDYDLELRLRRAQVSGMTNSACQTRYPFENVTENHLCALNDYDQDFCDKDEGGNDVYILKKRRSS